MTTALQIAKRVNRGYLDVYIKRRSPDGTYEADWLDVSRFVSSRGVTVDYSLDSGDLDIGLFTVGNITVGFNNRTGRFSEPWDCRSHWAAFETRHLTKVKVEAGYLDDDDQKLTEQAFQGLIEDRGTATGDQDEVVMKALSREAAFNQVTVPVGLLSSSILASEAILVLCSRGEIAEHMTVTAANINPANDITIDDPSTFGARKLNDVLSEIMLLTDSVLYVNEAGALVVRNRQHTRRVKRDFRKNAATGKSDNIYSISNFNSGRQRARNYWQWTSSTIEAKSDAHHLIKWGVTKKTVSSSAITNASTKLAILEGLRDQWQFPKREIEIATDYLANEITFFDTVTLDVEPHLDRRADLAIAGTGSALAGTARAAAYTSGLFIEPLIGFKVIGLRHDLGRFQTILRLREKGTQLNDGYIMIPLTKSHDATVAGVPLDVDVAQYEMNARLTKVEVLDVADDYATVPVLGIQRPDEDTLRINLGAFSGDVRLLLCEVEE